MITGAGGGVEESIVIGRYLGMYLLPRCFYYASVMSVVLCGSETWAMKEYDLTKLEGNNMVVWWRFMRH